MTSLPRLTILLLLVNSFLLGCYLIGARGTRADAALASEGELHP